MEFSKRYREILDQAIVPGQASDELIAAAEDDLGVVFPAAYRQFLETYGLVTVLRRSLVFIKPPLLRTREG